MKANKLVLAALAFAGLATLSLAGPGPQFWAQQAGNQPAQKATVAPADAACSSCACCGAMKKA